MFQKFIINRDGVLKFGRVYLHRDMLSPGEQCTYGGGLWKIDEGRGAIVLYGRSFDFGPPDFDFVKLIDWTGLGGTLARSSICLIGLAKKRLCQSSSIKKIV